MKRVLLISLFLMLSSGCSFNYFTKSEPTISDVNDYTISVTPNKINRLSNKKISRKYEDLLKLNPNEKIKMGANSRLAALELEQSETAVVEHNKQIDSAYRPAIERYEYLLDQYPNSKNNDEILYQLSRAYDQSGKSQQSHSLLTQIVNDFPESKLMPEVQFRRGEYLFSMKKYADSKIAYKNISPTGKVTKYDERALYKTGWSYLKLNENREALDSFFLLLDKKHNQIETLQDKELINDTFRSVSLVFSTIGGSKSISNYLGESKRSYEYLIYSHLGDYYLKQHRIQDAANTFSRFFILNPSHNKSPDLQVMAIQAYEKNGFELQANNEKEKYIEKYLYGSADRVQAGDNIHLDISKKYTIDIANYHHTLSQNKITSKQKTIHIQKAIKWYRSYLTYFKDDSNAAKINYLLADILFESNNYQDAYSEYESTAYNYGLHAKSSDAAYSAIIAIGKAKKSQRLPSVGSLDEREIISSLKFVDSFPNDLRWAGVLTRTAEKLYLNDKYQLAFSTAKKLVDSESQGDKELYTTSLTILSHSAFELKNYAEAEVSYAKLLKTKSIQESSRLEWRERVAASIYYQGIKEKEKGRHEKAIYHFLRVRKNVPKSPIAPSAEYDAVSVLIEGKQWKKSVDVMEGFLARNKGHKLEGDIQEKLAVAYLESNNKLLAAKTFEKISKNSNNMDVSRDAASQAILLHRESNNSKDELRNLKLYVKRFPFPFEEAIEARQRISILYESSKQYGKQHWWLKQIITLERKEKKLSSTRTRFLAAKASLVFARLKLQKFEKVRLVNPLNKNLSLKKKTMKSAISAYDNAASYNVASVTTEAAYQTARIYRLFATSMLNSERPKGLNDEELDSYNLILEDRAYPFEEEAIKIYTVNVKRIPSGLYDKWITKSLEDLAILYPARYQKSENTQELIYDFL